MERTPSPLLATLVTAVALATLTLGRDRRAVARAEVRAPDRPERVRAPGRPERGSRAETPGRIPRRGWWQVLHRTATRFSDDRLLTEAAGITFFTLLAVFPAMTALVSLYGLFADPAAIAQHLETLSNVIPGGGMQILEEQIQRLTAKGHTTLGLGALLGLGVALWSANGGMKALCDALNIAYGEEERRSFLRRTLITLALTIGGILFMLLAMAAVLVLPVVLNLVGLGGTADLLLRALRWPLLLLAVIFLLACIYRFGPSREQPKWRWVSWGSALAAAIWLIGSVAFSWYVANFGNYNETYGSLGAVIGFMTWIWLSATIVLLGAELNAELEHQTSRDTTTGPARPLGTRGAVKADTVAE
jgi:membrane protein